MSENIYDRPHVQTIARYRIAHPGKFLGLLEGTSPRTLCPWNGRKINLPPE